MLTLENFYPSLQYTGVEAPLFDIKFHDFEMEKARDLELL